MSVYSDGAGTHYPPVDALQFLVETANRPIVVASEAFLGHGAIGGFLMTPSLIGKEAAQLALRILDGESASNIPVSTGNVVRPVFDWRQMQRWGISASSLPPGSEIRFRDPTAWEQYRGQIIAILAAVLLQALLIAWLVHERNSRWRAETAARDTMSEVTQLNRLATAGELSATIAHEVSQPLTGMVMRANAALRSLSGKDDPEVDKARTALNQIVSAGHRASDVVASVRSMFKKDTQKKSEVDINKMIRSVLHLFYIDLRRHSIDIHIDLAKRLPHVIGNETQLQQVVLNLITNAIESMRSTELRVLSIKSGLAGQNYVHVSIEDTGAGIETSDVDRVFKPLFTTKATGMGLGLSVCHSIIESHDGRIWVSAGGFRGSIFHFELPAVVEKRLEVA
jgi:signal transduction histidine kinase